MIHRLIALLCLMALVPAVHADEPFLLKPGAKVLFVGDSITHSGGYIQYVDAYLLTRFPQAKYELINVGLGSETVTGLSEPDHPWPRPDIHERFERALEKTKPDVVIACYGMNDGIYYPFAEERFQKYQAGIRKLIDKAKKAKATVVLMTPPPFDPLPLAAKVRPATAEKFAWFAPYKDYDDRHPLRQVKIDAAREASRWPTARGDVETPGRGAKKIRNMSSAPAAFTNPPAGG